MVIKDDKIMKATENELYTYWLRRWSDFMSFEDYKEGCLAIGVEITEKEEYGDDN